AVATMVAVDTTVATTIHTPSPAIKPLAMKATATTERIRILAIKPLAMAADMAVTGTVVTDMAVTDMAAVATPPTSRMAGPGIELRVADSDTVLRPVGYSRLAALQC